MTTAATSKRQLKRLSLLQTTPNTSPAVELVDSPESSSVHSFRHNRSAGTSVSSPSSYATNSSAGSGASSSTRRQSTISYVSREEQHSPFSSPSDQKQAPASSSPSPRNGTQNAEEEPSTTRASNRDRAALTLVEKHADLLRFIAQKESKCLELRSQLAAHESELLELKRKWERIVSRGFSGAAPTNSPALSNKTSQASDASDASPPTAAVLSGIRESMQGVGRFIAGLSVDTATTTNSSYASDSEKERHVVPAVSSLRKSKLSRMDHEYNSSVSTSYTDASSRLSQSSMSSFDDVPPDDCANHADVEETTSNCSAILSEEMVTATSAQRRSTSIRRRKDLSVSLQPTATPSSPILEPHISLASRQAAPQTQLRPNHKRTATMAGGSLPPPSSIPGLSTFATGNISPLPLPTFSSWVDTVGKSMGKKLDQIQGGRVHKRASTLLSEASNSIFAVLAPPSPSAASASCANTGSMRKTSNKARKMIPTPPTSAKSVASQHATGSLIDDVLEDELDPTGSRIMTTLIPDKAPNPSGGTRNVQPSFNDTTDSDEWNW